MDGYCSRCGAFQANDPLRLYGFAPGALCTCNPKPPLEPPIHIDIERMERALAGPRYTLPNGLTPEQIVQYIDDCADGKIPPDTLKVGE